MFCVLVTVYAKYLGERSSHEMIDEFIRKISNMCYIREEDRCLKDLVRCTRIS